MLTLQLVYSLFNVAVLRVRAVRRGTPIWASSSGFDPEGRLDRT